ncbi:unnamed protein product [Caenorhabditis auriculariae]|uniref:Adenosine kinase n=1 Tax=Caenorhabditis auriculariae TaxID=2777116 RepID=A0A8S1HJ86_9PELO|nr:unnamed protein product [Caenorhabditis auriculariae]
MSLPENVLIGMCNPLLDIQTRVEKPFLDKWGLKENDAILCDDKLAGMFDELAENYEVEYIPGGAAQNALRVCQWILNNPKRSVFFGAVGSDKFGEMLRSKAQEAGVNAQYQVNETVKTGTCAALINGTHRSLCAHLAAANTFTVDHLNKAENVRLVDDAKFYYITGFFITVCPPAIMQIANHSNDHNKTFMLNLSAPFISQFFFEPLSQILPYVDVLFGNEDEAAAFAKAAGFDTTDVKEIALKAAALPKKSNRKRLIVFTQGPDPVIVVDGDSVTEFPVKRLAAEEIIDTNGAGDAFVGGFLAQFIQGKSLAEAVECGCYAACEIIKKQGCTVPESCKYH